MNSVHRVLFILSAVAMSVASYASCSSFVGTYHRLSTDALNGEKYYEEMAITDEGNFFKLQLKERPNGRRTLTAECEGKKLLVNDMVKVAMYLTREGNIQQTDASWTRGAPPSSVANGSTSLPKQTFEERMRLVREHTKQPVMTMPSFISNENDEANTTHRIRLVSRAEGMYSVESIGKKPEISGHSEGEGLFGLFELRERFRLSGGNWISEDISEWRFEGDWKIMSVGKAIGLHFQKVNSPTKYGFVCDVLNEFDASKVHSSFRGVARRLRCAKMLGKIKGVVTEYIFFDAYQFMLEGWRLPLRVIQ